MSVDCYLQVKLPTNLSKEDFNKYFQAPRLNDYGDYVCMPTDTYLKLAAEHLMKEDSRYTQELIAKHLYTDYNIHYTDEGSIIVSDSFRLNGGNTLLDPLLISELYKDEEIEVSEFTGCRDEKYYFIAKNGEIVKEPVTENECELGRYNHAEEEKWREEWLKSIKNWNVPKDVKMHTNQPGELSKTK